MECKDALTGRAPNHALEATGHSVGCCGCECQGVWPAPHLERSVKEKMRHSFFKQGGPYKVRKTGRDRYSFSIPMPEDEQGRIARKCSNENCSPGYFKVKPSTGITEGQEVAFCPYCRHKSEPDEFATDEQVRYAQDIMMREAQKGVQDMVGDALGVGRSGRKKLGGGMFSIEMTYKPGRLPHIRRPLEEELERDVICPHCDLHHAVFGIAVWCADCGKDVFLTHVEAEFTVVAAILSDVDRRRANLGPRVAARDLENCLEDTVSIFEAVGKALVIRSLRENSKTEEETHDFLKKKVRNAFQSVERMSALLKTEFNVSIAEHHSEDTLTSLRNTFEKRHPITHNLGVVDRKYLEKALSAEKEGREIRVTRSEIEKVMADSIAVIKTLHTLLVKADT